MEKKSANFMIRKVVSLLVVFVMLLGMVPQLGGSVASANPQNPQGWELLGDGRGITEGEAFNTNLKLVNGKPYIAFKDGAQQGKVTVMEFVGKNWQPVGAPGLSEGAAETPVLAADGETLYVAYQDDANDNRITVKRFDGTQWRVVGDSGISLSAATNIQMVIDQGQIYVAYRDNEVWDNSFVSTYIGDQWEVIGKGPVTIESAETHSLYVDNGVPYLAYQNSNGSMAAVQKFENDKWIQVGEDGFSEGKALFLSLQVNQGIPYLFYTDAGLNNMSYVRKFEEGEWTQVGPAVSWGSSKWNQLKFYDGAPYVAFLDSAIGYLPVFKTLTKQDNWRDIADPAINAQDMSDNGISFELSPNGAVYYSFTDMHYGMKATVLKTPEPITYSIASIADQTFSELKESYPFNTQESKEIKITNTGTGALDGIKVSVRDGYGAPTAEALSTGTSNFEIIDVTMKEKLELNDFTTFWVRAKSFLEAGTYVGTVTITANNMIPVTFKVTQVVGKNTQNQPGLEPIEEQTLTPLIQGYAQGSQGTKTVKLTKSGAGKLEGLYMVSGSPDPMDHFDITPINEPDLSDEIPSGSFTVTLKNNRSAGTYNGTILIYDKSQRLLATVIIKQVVQGKPTYSIKPIGEQTFRELEEGYAIDSQETKDITITNTGTGALNNLQVSVRDGFGSPPAEDRSTGTTNFEINDDALSEASLKNNESVMFKVKAKDGLPAGTYVGTVTIEADNLTPVTFKVTQVVHEAEVENPGIIDAVKDQTLPALEEGYAQGEALEITLSKSNRQDPTVTGLRLEVINFSTGEVFSVSKLSQDYLNNNYPNSRFSIQAVKGLLAGTYGVKIKVYSNDLLLETFTVSQTVHAAENVTYSIAPIADQKLAELTFGYASGTQEAKSITITKTGTANLTNVSTELYDHMESRTASSGSEYFEVTQPLARTLDSATTSTTFTVKAKDGLAAGTYTTTVKVNAADMVPVYFKVTQVVNPQTTTYNPSVTPTADPGVDVLVNGKKESAGKVVNSTVDNRSVTTFTLDEQKLTQKLAAEGKHAVVTLPVNSQADVIVGELNGRMVKTMAGTQAVLEIKTETATYTLPAEQINIDSLAAAIGKDVALSDIKLQVTIAKAKAETVQLVENAGSKGSFTVVASPVSFTITANHSGQTVKVHKFNAYVARTIALPAGVDPNKITTGIVIDPDGTVRHVPTEITVVNGIYYAKLNSLTNSDYSVVWHPLTFTDAEGHWAQAAINDMGSRMVVSGNGQGLFNPNANITRAEFASIVIQGLGLKPVYQAGLFSDIAEDAWYSGAVSTAYEYDLIAGFPDGTFQPDTLITREQAMTIIAKAMKLTGLKDKLPGQDLATVLADYTDGGKVAGWAATGVAECVQAEIIKGRSVATLAPKANLTRAEMAVIIRLLLQNSDLI